MNNYKFNFNGKTYELSLDKFDYLLNDEENEVTGIDREGILTLLNESPEVDFDLEYYSVPCEICLSGKEEKKKYFNFLEYHFTIFTKENEYVMSNISKEFENTSFTELEALGKIDNSFIVIIMVCESCGTYSIEINQCDI